MAEQSNKGVALVILGIVAIIAIVGLVLLFTGARGSTGEFAVPSVKEYGGAIQGVYDPYSRAFSGRATFPSGAESDYLGTDISRGGSTVHMGENPLQLSDATIQAVQHATFNRDWSQVPSVIKATLLAHFSGMPGQFVLADANEAWDYQNMGRRCVELRDLNAVSLDVTQGDYGLARENILDLVANSQASGESHICEFPGLQ